MTLKEAINKYWEYKDKYYNKGKGYTEANTQICVIIPLKNGYNIFIDDKKHENIAKDISFEVFPENDKVDLEFIIPLKYLNYRKNSKLRGNVCRIANISCLKANKILEANGGIDCKKYIAILKRSYIKEEKEVKCENKDVISSFTDKYFFLSNYFETNVIYKGLSYSSSEAAYQAQKCAIPGMRIQFSLIIDPDQAKKLSKQILVVDNWHEIKLGVMKEVVKAKFDQNPKLKSLLLKTRNKILIEGNTWGDKYWGQVDGIGENHLGIILMELRDEYALEKKNKVQK